MTLAGNAERVIDEEAVMAAREELVLALVRRKRRVLDASFVLTQMQRTGNVLDESAPVVAHGGFGT